MDKSETIGKLAKALSAFQGEVRDAFKAKSGRSHSYADLQGVLDIARPLLEKHELSISQLPQASDATGIHLNNILMHSSGEWLSSSMFMPLVKITNQQGKEVINVAQQIGSAISYARRYCLTSLLGFTQTDDDDNAESYSQDDTPRFKQKESNIPERAPEVMISDEQIAALIQVIEDAGSTVEKICAHCKVKELKELTLDSYNRISNILFAKILENAESKNGKGA